VKALRIYVDGSSLGNPGPAGIGIVVCDEQENILTTHQLSLPNATNNEAEYHAVIEALKLAKNLGADEVVILSDSELIVQQLNGNYRVKSPNLFRLHKPVGSEGFTSFKSENSTAPTAEGENFALHPFCRFPKAR
jgi:ribonuclease HI